MSIELEIKGLDKVLRGLDERTLDTLMRNAMEGAVEGPQRDMMVYPPKPPESTYRRTHILQKGWTTKVESQANAWLGIIGNRVEYAPYVQDAARQAWMHKGRWQTAQDVVKKRTDWVVNLISAKVSQWIARM